MPNIKQYEPLWNTWYIESLLGKGSFGEVYKIRREAFGKIHYSAVKIITIPQEEDEIHNMENEGLDPISIRNFLQALLADLVCEIDMMNELRGNSNIVSFEDYQVIEKPDGIGWDILMRMELLHDISFHSHKSSFSHAEILKIGIHICRALELCAQKNIIHRDIKPENIFISQYGEYKLGDFGIARHLERTMSGLSQKGTCNYMAPEVFRGESYGANVDIYSLGIVMYRLLNRGRIPFLPDFPHPILPRDRDNALQTRMSGYPVPDLKDVSPELNAIVQKACAYSRHVRYSTPTEMREDLEAVAGIMRTPGAVGVTPPINTMSPAGVAPSSSSSAYTHNPVSADAYQPGDTPIYAPSSHTSSPYDTTAPLDDPSPYTLSPPTLPTIPSPPSLNRKEKKSWNIAILTTCGILVTALAVILFFLIGTPAQKTDSIAHDVINDDPLLFDADHQTIDQLYQTLGSMIDSQDISLSSELPDTFTFTVKILSETETRTVEGQERIYQRATIARRADKDFLLDVNDLQEYPKVDAVVSVSSTSCSTIDWVANNEQNSLLIIKADSIQPVKPKSFPVNTGPTIDGSAGLPSSNAPASTVSGTTNSTLEFKGAHFSRDPFKKKVVVIYFNFTNASNEETSSTWDEFDMRPYISLGDNNKYLEDTIFSPDEVDDQALSNSAVNRTSPGKTTYYYAIYEIPDSNKDSRLYIKKYDDDFNLTDNIVLDVASSLTQMKG